MPTAFNESVRLAMNLVQRVRFVAQQEEIVAEVCFKDDAISLVADDLCV